jgi:alpha,alpha-trehalose phosphorylase
MRVEGDILCFDPVAIPGLGDYSFTMTFRSAPVDVVVSGRTARVSVRGEHNIRIRVGGENVASSDATPRTRAL